MSCQVSRRACGSRPVVSSSRIAIFGLPMSASAIESRCFWPPDSLPNVDCALVGEPEVVEQLLASRGVPRRTRRRGPSPPRRGCWSGSSLSWSWTPTTRRSSSRSRARVEPEHADRARVRRPQPADGLDRGGLAGAVRAEDGEDLALLDREGHAVDRRVVAVALDEVGDFDDVHGPSVARTRAPSASPGRVERAVNPVDGASTDRLTGWKRRSCRGTIDPRRLGSTPGDLPMSDETGSRPGLIRSIAHRLAGERLALPVEGRLASFDGATGWLNSEPLTPEGLRGRVVLVDFWTYTCVNWLRTLPYVRAWAAKYADAGLTVVGVHTPEFGFEHNVDNVIAQARDARRRLPDRARQRLRGLERVRQSLLAGRLHRGCRRPDPISPLRRGRIRGDRDGDPAAADGRRRGRRRSGPGDGRPSGLEVAADWRTCSRPRPTSATARAAASPRTMSPGSTSPRLRRARTAPAQLLGALGDWTVAGHAAVSNEPGGRVAFQFHARDLNLVMGPASRGAPIPFRVFLDGQPAEDAMGRRERRRQRDRRRPAHLSTDPPTGADRRPPVRDRVRRRGVEAYCFTFG